MRVTVSVSNRGRTYQKLGPLEQVVAPRHRTFRNQHALVEGRVRTEKAPAVMRGRVVGELVTIF